MFFFLRLEYTIRLDRVVVREKERGEGERYDIMRRNREKVNN